MRGPTGLRATGLALWLLVPGWAAPAAWADGAPVRAAVSTLDHVTEEVSLSGTVTARRNASLSPRVSGLVAAVHVDAGDRVAAGDRLLDLDRALAELELERIRAARAEAEARLVEAQRLGREARELDVSRVLAKTEVRAREAQIRIASAARDRLEAEVREQEERVARHMLVAPFAGVVSRKLAEVGEWVETGTPVLALVETEGVRLDVQVPQERFHDIDTDTPVRVRPDAAPDAELAGRVTATVPVKDPSARTFLVRIHVDDAGDLLTPGMSARATFLLQNAEPALVLPRDAIVRDPQGTTSVWVIEERDGDTVASRRTVRIGRTFAERVEIVDGLGPGTRVVVRGNETLQEGETVRLLPAES